MKDRYEILSEFECCGQKIVIVKLNGNVHILPQVEWQWIFGQMHPERWSDRDKTKKNTRHKNVA